MEKVVEIIAILLLITSQFGLYLQFRYARQLEQEIKNLQAKIDNA